MKLINKISQILSVIFGLGSVLLFFAPFATITAGGNTVTPVAAQLAFGSKLTVGGTVYNMGMSAHILFVFCLIVIAFLTSIFAFKSKSLRYSASAFSLISAVYMWVIALKKDSRFVDTQVLKNVTGVEHTSFVLILAIVTLLFAVFAIAYLLIDDYIEAKANGGKTIWQKVVLFLRDNKSEVKKIVWPSLRDVLKNTLTVLVMCLVIGAIIWAIDFGLGQLLELILGA
jgi:preprotein translocase subunit SecE